MDITIFGAGAVGGYVGARLMEAGVPVSFLVREKRAKQLRENGLGLTSDHGHYETWDATIYTSAEDVKACDIVILAVKSYHVEGALPQLRQLVNDKGAKVLPFLNGMEHFHRLAKELGEANVLGGLAKIMATLDEAGHIVQTGENHHFMFGPMHPAQNDICRRLDQAVQHANMNMGFCDHISRALWQKYVFITAFSGVTTATRLPAGKIRQVPVTLQLFQEVAKEMKNLATAYGVEIDEQLVDVFTSQIKDLPEEGTSSMHKDFRKGLPIEVESLHGGALRLAKEKGLTLSAIETIYALLKPYEDGA